MINKNDELELNIESLGVNGEGVAKHDGAVVFVPYALSGEIVKAKIIFARSKFYVAKILKIIKPSPDRVSAPCPYFTKCGGCDLQHLEYDKQLNFKTELVLNNIKKIAKIDFKVFKTISSKNQFNYRNKFSFPIGIVDNVPQVGMYKANSHEIIAIKQCLIQEDWSNTMIKIFNEFLSKNFNTVYNEQTKSGLIKHLVCRFSDEQLLVCVVLNGSKLNSTDYLIKLIGEKFNNFGLSINVNTENNNVILTNNYKHIYGLKNITIINNGIVHEININSFMQVNSFVANCIYNQVLTEVNNEIVVNAYSGAGLLSAMLSKTAKQVFGIEIVKSAHENAQELIKRNNITNVINVCGDVAKELKNIATFDAIVLDPPRKGCDKVVIETINSVAPDKIIYVSCDSATLARDISNLTNYAVVSVQPFDMFPQTKHVETLCVLRKK